MANIHKKIHSTSFRTKFCSLKNVRKIFKHMPEVFSGTRIGAKVYYQN